MNKLLLAALIGFSVIASVVYFLTKTTTDSSMVEAEKKSPLYWVAPMDPNYRRDKPGKSLMGMDLVPVFDNVSAPGDTGSGMVYISPDVINNLGVRTEKVHLRALQTDIKTVGYVKYDEDRLTHIHPRVEGWIETLHVKASGDQVEKGQPLYSLYSPQLVNAQEEFLLAKNRNNARLIQAAEERLRALQLSEAFIENLKRQLSVQQRVTFYARRSGVVDNLNIREGFFVKPGTTLMSIGSLDEVWVEAEVFERQGSLVKAGQSVTMILDYLPDMSWEGEVDYVYPVLDAKTRTARVRMRFVNANGVLKPNMFAEVIIHQISASETLVIPREAVIRTGNEDRVVIALGQGRYKSLAVELGAISGEFAEIKSGLSEGDSIVISAQFLLDSESSKNAGFQRMEQGGHQPSSAIKDEALSNFQEGELQ